MKIINHRHDLSITAASSPGTSIYILSPQDVEDAIRGTNLIAEEAFKLYRWDAFDLESMYGSEVVGNDFYLLKTDGNYINIDGEDVDPEELLAQYEIEDIPEYLFKEKDDSVIRSNFSPYELSKKIDLNEIALSLLQSGFKFTSIVDDARDADMID